MRLTLFFIPTAANAQAQHQVELQGITPTSCTAQNKASDDLDRDGIRDECESALALAFRPTLHVDPHDDIGGEPYFAVRRLASAETHDTLQAFRIMFLLAYYNDLGWGSGRCTIYNALERARFWNRNRQDWCAGHRGDSEFLVFDVSYDASNGAWHLARAFLSAHWRARTDDSSTLTNAQQMLTFAGAADAFPEIWVSARKHANYPTRRHCDSAHHGQDSCLGNVRTVRLDFSADHNIGSRSSNPGCVRSERRYASSPKSECFWVPGDTFDGWQDAEPRFRVTPYEEVLRTFGF